MTENSGTSTDVDLFGNPMQPLRDRRGRPSFRKTPENQQFVALRAAAGWTRESIAQDMGIDPKTLRKNFSRELEQGALMIEGQILDVLSQRARQGHVSAVKALNEVVQKGQVSKRAREYVDTPAPSADEPVGKKEAARRAAAETASNQSDIWGGDLMPGKYDA